MSDAWITILALIVATVLIKATGPVLVGGRELPPVVLRVIALLAPALLAALIVTETFGTHDQGLTIDPRAAGLAAAGVGVAFTDSLVGTMVFAAAATALTRALV